jgi:hypothetical protein
MLVADPSTLIPAYLALGRNDRSYVDTSADFQVEKIKDFAVLKWYTFSGSF